ncbi:MAG: hypothetical protein R6X20_15605 [Phycisphaerae bacterium]
MKPHIAFPKRLLASKVGSAGICLVFSLGIVRLSGCAQVGELGPATCDRQTVSLDVCPASYDVRLGLAGSVAVLGRVPCWNVPKRPDIKERDMRLRNLHGILSLLPKDKSPECLVCDIYVSGGDDVSLYETVLLCQPRKASESVKAAIKYLGFHLVENKQWRQMLPWMKGATERQPVGEDTVLGASEIVVFSYYDGAAWRIMPHFFLSHLSGAGGSEPVTRPDLDVFRLMHYVTEDLGKASGFEKRYGEYPLWLRMLWPEIEEAIRREGKWTIDMMD